MVLRLKPSRRATARVRAWLRHAYLFRKHARSAALAARNVQPPVRVVGRVLAGKAKRQPDDVIAYGRSTLRRYASRFWMHQLDRNVAALRPGAAATIRLP
jgi:hypothetical protein